MQFTKVEVIKFGKTIEVDPSWINLIDYVKKVPYCEMKVIFKEGKPVLAENVKESIKF